MRRRTSLATTLDVAGLKARYDKCVKRLLSEKIVLAWILKECAVEFRKLAVCDIVKNCIVGEPQISTVAVDQDVPDADETDGRIEGLNTEDSSIKEGAIFYDIRFSAIAPGEKNPVHLIVNIEAQKDADLTYPIVKRAIYYASRMISGQKNTVFVNDHYEQIRKVYSIWIVMNAPKKEANTMMKYRITELPVVGSVPEKESDYDLLTVVILRLGAPNAADDGSLLRLLDVLLSSEIKPTEKKTILEKDFDVPMTTSMKEETNVMCNLAEGIWEKAERVGEERGLKIGEERGLKIGEERGLKIGEERGLKIGEERGLKSGAKRATLETRTEVALNLMNSLKMSAEEVLSAMRVPARSRASLLKTINERLASE